MPDLYHWQPFGSGGTRSEGIGVIFFSLLLDWGGAGCVAGLMIES